MSATPMLFASAFNPGASAGAAGPSSAAANGKQSGGGSFATTGGHSNGGKKRKRPSNSGPGSSQDATTSAYAKRDSVKQAQSSLEKAMKQLGKSLGPSGAGGTLSKKKKPNSKAAAAEESPAKRSKMEMKAEKGGSKKAVSAKSRAEGSKSPASSAAVPSPTKPASTSSTPFATPPTSTTQASLTPLQSKLSSKLSSAKFRWLNEQLYSLPSSQGAQLMASSIASESNADAKAFDAYHDAHRQQTAAWPVPPLPLLAAKLREDTSLPREGAVVLDLGCGDAELARSLLAADPAGRSGKKAKKNKGKQSANGEAAPDDDRHFKVISYDLVGDVEALPMDASSAPSNAQEENATNKSPSSRGYVVPVDFLTLIPLPGDPGGRPVPANSKLDGGKNGGPEIVDAAVCCLSLMGVNWLGGIYEATRVLKKGGSLHVAEVTSRIVSRDAFVAAITSFGLELVEHSAPTTHFDLFHFRKTSPWPMGVVKGQGVGWEARVKRGEKVLKGCVYKKR